MHCMIDVETLATTPNAAMFQIGAVAFEMVSGGRVYNGAKSFNADINMNSSIEAGMDVDGDTIAWWMNQSECARKIAIEAMTNGDILPIALAALNEWPIKALDLDWSGFEGIWAHPSEFDIPVLRSAFSRCGIEVPWDRRKIYDTRTVYLLAGGQPEVESVGTSHNAVDDCEYQICQLQKALQLLSP